MFAEITFHAAYEPQRAVRTRRYKYIRRYERPVIANIDDSPSKDYLLARGLAERDAPSEQLYDLVFDPNEAHNIADSEPAIAAELRSRLQAWMEETGDPLLDGPVVPAPGTEYNTAGQRSPAEPTTRARSTHGIVLQTQADAPAGLLGEWARKRDIALSVVRADEHDAYPDPRDPDFVVALGSGATAAGGGPEWVEEEIEWLRAADGAALPILGICFGAQALAA